MKKRLDVLLVERGLVSGRDRAKGFIMAGQVYVDQQKADKPGQDVSTDAQIELRADTPRYVSRGGLKLEKAVEVFGLSLSGACCLDIGASTGGFTDCMLQNGAARVYAIDVGYGQLAWKLRSDDRVVVLERTNIRYVTDQQVPDLCDFASVDVSFISLTLVLPVMQTLLGPQGEAVCLIKPQFEAGREKVGKKGVVRERSTHREVVEKILGAAAENGFLPLGLDYSPVRGPEGNIEYLLHLRSEQTALAIDDGWSARAAEVVDASHTELDT